MDVILLQYVARIVAAAQQFPYIWIQLPIEGGGVLNKFGYCADRNATAIAPRSACASPV